jgi:small subunit ribosomal protein S16
VAVKIKLKRLGKIRQPQYRVVVADARTKRDGRAIEQIGLYHPKEEPSRIEIDSDRAQYWLSVGAQPTEPVLALLKVTGDWQKHKGLPGAEGTLKVKPPKADKTETFNRLLSEAHREPQGNATTARKGRPSRAPSGSGEPSAATTGEPSAATTGEPTAGPAAEVEPAAADTEPQA